MNSKIHWGIALTLILIFSSTARAQVGNYSGKPGDPSDGSHVPDEILVRYKSIASVTDMDQFEYGNGFSWRTSGPHGKVRRLRIKKGMTLDAAYHMGSWSGAVCTPSRHMVMSGRTVWHLPRNGVRGAGPNPLCPEDLADHTLAAVFNRGGYGLASI